jgi:hypothetical protein
MLAAPPVVLIAGAQIVRSRAGGWTWYLVLPAPAFILIASLRASGWSQTVQALVAILYTFAAIPLLPLLVVIAACAAGDGL